MVVEHRPDRSESDNRSLEVVVVVVVVVDRLESIIDPWYK
jgi:hypothetical protein